MNFQDHAMKMSTPAQIPEFEDLVNKLRNAINVLGSAQAEIEAFLIRLGAPCPIVPSPSSQETISEMPTVLSQLQRLSTDLNGHVMTAERHASQARLLA